MTISALLEQALESLAGGANEVTLEFGGVARIDTAALGALQKLAARADGTGARVILRDVHTDVYKVLKLMKLAERFSFAN